MFDESAPLRTERETLADIKLCGVLSDLMSEIWGLASRDVLPPWKLLVTPRIGGELVVSYIDNDPIGFAVCSLGDRARSRYLYLDAIGVVERYQSFGVGEKMIRCLADVAFDRGLGSIEWTYDPLEGANANLYVRKLGAVGTRFYRDYYGDLSGKRHRGSPTDRLWVQLSVPIQTPQEKIILPLATFSASEPIAHVVVESLPSTVGISIPKLFADLRQQDPRRAAVVRETAARLLDSLMAAGYKVVGFSAGEPENTYFLRRSVGDTSAQQDDAFDELSTRC